MAHPGHVKNIVQRSRARLAKEQTPRVQAAPFLNKTWATRSFTKTPGTVHAQRGPRRGDRQGGG